MKKLLHWIAHQMGWNYGSVYTWYDSDTGKLMVGFRCDGCETISGVHESKVKP